MSKILPLTGIALASILIGQSPASASCPVPNTLTNGQVADATQVMGNFNALGNCSVSTTGSTPTGGLTVFSGTKSVTGGNLTGDVTTSGGTATTLSTSGVTAGTYSNSNITVDAKGRITAASSGTAFGGIDGANVNTLETTSSTSYTDLTTSGPSVTITTGSTAFVTISAVSVRAVSGAGNTAYLSFAVSGATTIAATDANGTSAASPGHGFGMSMSRRLKITGLTPGSNTFTVKYRIDGATFNFANRSIVVESTP